ncbi:MAG: hypothetical protein HYX72_11135 [Acidobacteria bacterium]|nr:hypothetical protein [Acidobacteriota bacterium]
MNNTAIHYEGFAVVATNRLYNFSVDGTSDERRKFTVQIEPASFFTTRLKFQDGPAISMQRLKREIEQESPDSPAKAHLTISGQDVEDYLVAQFPKKATKKRFHAAAVASGRHE